MSLNPINKLLESGEDKEEELDPEIKPDGGVADKPMSNRRGFLKAAGAIGGAATVAGAGYAGFNAINNPNTPGDGQNPPNQPGPENQTETPEEETPTPEPGLPEEGSINIILDGEQPWPEQYFSGNIDLELETDIENVRNLHHNQHRQAKLSDERKEEILAQFPHKIDDPEWLRNKIYTPIEEEYEGDDVAEDHFEWGEYNQDAALDVRMKESGYPYLWMLVEGLTMGHITSDHDDIRAAELQAVEHYQLENDTIATPTKTVKGGHGLVDAITHATYDPSEYESQETWIVETDPGEDQPIIDLDQEEAYTNDHEKHHVEVDGEATAGEGWFHMAGFVNPRHVDINWNQEGEYDEFLKNPGQQSGMKFLDSACLVKYIGKEAHQNGELPEFEDATLEIYPDRIEYQL